MQGASSGLRRSVRTFRLGAYTLAAAALLALAGTSRPLPLLIAGGIGFMMLGVARSRVRGATTLASQAAESVLGSGLAGLLALPAVPLLTVLMALTSGAAALGGRRWLAVCGPAAALGLAAGSALAPVAPAPSTPVADLLFGALLLLLSALLCARGHRQAMRLHGERQTVAGQVRALSRYVPEDLMRRLNRGEADRECIRRDWISVCFVDLVGFTSFTRRAAPEEVSTLLDRFFTAMGELARASGGAIDKFAGDGLLISFHGERSASAGRAVAFGRAVPARLTVLAGEDGLAGTAVEVRARVGVASGYCTIGGFGTGPRREYTVIGPAVNLASRLMAVAAPGEIVVCAATRALLSEPTLEPAPEDVALTGMEGPVRCYRLTG